MAEPQKETQETGIATPIPSAVIMPESAPATVAPPAPAVPPVTPVTPAAVQPAVATPRAPQATQSVLPDSTPDPLPSTSDDDSATETDTQAITWTASEFHVHEKSAGWYIILAIATIGVAAILYLLTKSIVTPVVIVVCGATLGVYATHRPGELNYAMNRHGIRIGSKQYLYDEFQLFIVTPDSSIPEVTLIPVKRFMPSLSVRYTPENMNEVLGMLSEYLPFEERRPDLIDSLMRHIRF